MRFIRGIDTKSYDLVVRPFAQRRLRLGIRPETNTEDTAAHVREAHKRLRCCQPVQGECVQDEHHGGKVEVSDKIP